jgi:uncharacterized OB-fold protein
MCPKCQSMETQWLPSSGSATLYSWTVATHPVDAALADQVPYIIALVQLPEGVRLIANIVACPPDALADGLPLTLVFERQDEMEIPNFRPTAAKPSDHQRGQVPT